MMVACARFRIVPAPRWLPPFLARWFNDESAISSGSLASSDHFDGLEFHNLYGVPAGRTLIDVLRWKWLGGGMVRWPETVRPDAVEPLLPTAIGEREAAVTFIGHSTFLVQFAGGLNILTDPIWSERASPVAFAGPRRARPPALALGALPPVGIVLVSHGHYDHLDVPTLRQLDERFQPLFLTGLGNRAFLLAKGLRRVKELDWWQSHRLDEKGGGLNVTFTLAQHWSARSATKRNRTLWGGFWLATDDAPSVYFAGDSGYGAHFGLIRERMGAPDLALVPIGAYEPRWFMRDQHMNPDDAVQAHLALEARHSVAMHFGTFRLTDEGIDQPAEALTASLRARGVDPAAFRVPRFGETIRVAATPV